MAKPSLMSHLPDKCETLTKAVANGDEKAFAAFFDLFSPRLYRFALHLTQGNEDLAAEVHQITMVRAAGKMRAFQSDGQLWAWLCAIARNSHLDHVRKASLSWKLLRYLSFNDSIASESTNNDAAINQSLENALRHLPVEDFAVIELIYFHGKTHQDAASELHTTPKAVERKVSRIREQLRRFILKEMRDEEV